MYGVMDQDNSMVLMGEIMRGVWYTIGAKACLPKSVDKKYGCKDE